MLEAVSSESRGEADPVTAQEVLAALLKERVAPALRELGFRGSGQVFELRDEKHWALIGFQRSRYSRADELEFTVNVVVIGKQAWELMRADNPSLGRRPAPTDHTYAQALRLEQVDSDVIDPWWLVRPGSDQAEVAARVVAAVRDVLMPWVNSRLRRSDAPHRHRTGTETALLV